MLPAGGIAEPRRDARPRVPPRAVLIRRAVDDAAAQLYAAESAEAIDAILAELNITAAELVAEIE